MKFFTLAVLTLALLVPASASADQTTVSSNTWTVIYDSSNMPIAGLSGKLCYTVFLKTNTSEEVCTPDPVSTDSNGQISFVGMAIFGSPGDRPTNYAVTFDVNGTRYTGAVTAKWDPNCEYSNNWTRTNCNQAVHFEFRLPVAKSCLAKPGNGLTQQICTLASRANGLGSLAPVSAGDSHVSEQTDKMLEPRQALSVLQDSAVVSTQQAI